MRRLAIAFASIVLLLAAVYASIFPVAELGGEVVVLRPRDGSGAPHETRMWVVDRDGTPWVRGRPRRGWFRRIEADPRAELLRDGRWWPVEAIPSPDRADVEAVEKLIREKYGWAHTYTDLIARTSANEIPVELRSRPDASGIVSRRGLRWAGGSAGSRAPEPSSGGMEGRDILQTLAQVAVSLTGFTGIVVALRDRARNPLSGFARVRFRILLVASLASVGFALLPFLLFHLGVSPARAWSAGSSLVAIFMIGIATHDFRAARTFSQEMPALDRYAIPVTVLLGGSVWVAQLANVFFRHEFGLYLAAPMWLLAFSAFQFCRLLLTVDDTRPGAQDA